jgi:hypothetical protein
MDRQPYIQGRREIPTNLSPGLTEDFQRAVDKEGWTPQLERAAVMLPAILRMSPEDFERATAELYLSM